MTLGTHTLLGTACICTLPTISQGLLFTVHTSFDLRSRIGINIVELPACPLLAQTCEPSSRSEIQAWAIDYDTTSLRINYSTPLSF
jgi:hypothetical protein